MWTRSELKERAKVAFKRNYWKCVLVALILALLVGGGAGSSIRRNDSSQDLTAEQRQMVEDLSDLGDSGLVGAVLDVVERVSITQNKYVTISLGGLGLVGLVLGLLVFNPLIVGCYRFFLQNSRGPAELNELGAGFRGDWGNVVLVMFLKNLFLALWTMLFIIPGIVKAYAYRMVPYILKEHPGHHPVPEDDERTQGGRLRAGPQLPGLDPPVRPDLRDPPYLLCGALHPGYRR